MFRRLEPSGEADIEFTFDGRTITARPGETVAAALIAAGIVSFRVTHPSGVDRGPYCMMGACYDCLVEIGGVTVQACSVPVSRGLRVDRSGPATSPDGAQA